MRIYYRTLGIIHDAWQWIKAKSFQLVYGFDYRDTWNLDIAMAKWLYPRLRHLANVTHSYPGRDEYESEDGDKRWMSDLNKHADVFERYASRWGIDDFDEENRLCFEARESMKWIAKWYLALWD